MLTKTRSSLQFVWATLATAIMSLFIFFFILAKRDRPQSKTAPANERKAFLARKERASTFYRFFSRIYDGVNASFYPSDIRDEAVKLADVREDSLVLDVGCGTGYTTRGVLERLKQGQAVGVDLTPQQLRKAVTNLAAYKERLSLSRGDAESLPFSDEAFDAVVSVGALEYFPDPLKVFVEMGRVAKSGGRVVVGGPEAGWFSKALVDRVLYAPSRGEVEVLFRRAGFIDVTSFLVGVDTFFGTGSYVVFVAGTRPR